MPSIDQELDIIKIKLANLEQEKKILQEKYQKLLESKSIALENTNANAQHEVLSTDQKVKLFAYLFKGRDDIYAVRWENKQGRVGYSIACSNEWQPVICNKPKVKCSECSNRSFKPLNQQAIFDHLSGNQTIGLYPLLSNNHCWLLAADFDKANWQLDVTAFYEACVEINIPCAIERSRSGNGAHIWIFFDNPIPAKDARNFGFLLLDKAMENHAGLSFDSYDRLFPNQDIMPDGGFGNLIALPLQYVPRKSSNSVFVDSNFDAYPEQWSFLTSLNRVKVKRIYECLEVGGSSKTIDNEEMKPWEKGLPIAKDSISGCPKTLTIVLANRIYIPTDVLPQALLARLKRTASFSNPVFFKTQALRFSTHGIPRFICLAHIEQGYLSLPRGCLDDVLIILEQQLISAEFDDKRKMGQRIKKVQFKGELRKDQKKAVNELSKFDVGILHAPTAFGKTVVAIGLIYKRKVNTLILVHSRQLLDQWKERLEMFLDGVDVGVMGGGKHKPTGQIDVATYQSMINRKDNSVDQHLFDYGQIIIDECHHISAPNYDRLLSEVHAKYVLGITATPQRQDGHEPIIFMQAGSIRYTVKSGAREQFEQQVVVTELNTIPPVELLNNETRPHIADVYRWLMEYPDRNKQIIDDVVNEVEKKRNPIILTERREHAVILGELLAEQKVSFRFYVER
ncbi:MAG: DEAD/DEAH box helicase family protein [Bacteroidota bacterium]